MSKVAWLFPGQGSQRVGMGRDLCDLYPEIEEEYFHRADDVLGFALSEMCFNGPEEDLVRTENQQPAIFLVSCATAAVLRRHELAPQALAGHSLGEYSALVSAAAFDFDTGLRLTRKRGELMAGIASRTGGIMAAVVGLPADDVEGLCRQARATGVVEVANFNAPTQTVLSGEEPAVRRAMELARDARARKVVELRVSAPFHCSLMAPLAAEFRDVLRDADIHDPHVPVIANVDAEPEQTAERVRETLVEQLDHAVRWTASIEQLVGDGVDTVVEVGPQRVLTGLMRSIAPQINALHTSTGADVQRTIEELGGL